MAAPRLPMPDPRHLATMIKSFDLHLHAEGKAQKTRNEYGDAATRFAGWYVAGRPTAEKVLAAHLRTPDNAGGSSPVPAPRQPASGAKWSAVTKNDIQLWLVFLRECGYSDSYISTLYRALQQFFRWYSEEEEVPNPFVKLKSPKVAETLPPMLKPEELMALVKHTDSDKTFVGKRDAAILRMFASSGARLSELALLQISDVSLENRDALVHGKGGKDRRVKFDNKAVRALDRYLRARAEYVAARLDRIGSDSGAVWVSRVALPMTASGVRQAIERRAEEVGLDVNPHMFRHMFSHNWLDRGGAEGDLMELNGWDSPQMLARYGRSARASRAARAYDRINVMGGM